jgi:hypothetical protein
MDLSFCHQTQIGGQTSRRSKTGIGRRQKTTKMKWSKGREMTKSYEKKRTKRELSNENSKNINNLTNDTFVTISY